ncbi:MAG: single-stranded-DNA-specific exonuclease RecJ [Candidatus Margulisbacteria bacterium]|nr:single-stranded-DNA-specific exonuclease RecJ [Candidatus Margulisiibacteriota bacterium]
MKKWLQFAQQPELKQQFASELKLSPLLAQVLLNRGISTLKQAQGFLNPQLAELCDPFEIPNIDQAAKRVLQARASGEKVLVYGDYDVDGVTGTAIMLHSLKFLGISAEYYIPHRYDEGYSLSQASVKKIAAKGVKLVITVDCGTASLREIEQAKALGLDVIVTDHHNLPVKLPAAYAVVNPKLIAGEHPSKNLSGAGVAFKFAWALLRVAGEKDSVFLTSLLDLAALGTISDVVPLTAENRVLAVRGLKLLNERKRLGLKHLAEVSSIKGNLSVNHVYFALAPRINAAGRLEHATKSLELMLTEDEAQARALALELNKINVRRRGIGGDIKEEVFSRLDDSYISENQLILLSGENWHPGVIGIVASQLVDRFVRPAILVGVNEGIGRGSARSISGFNVFNLLNSCQDLFIDFGGHAGAAGFEIKADNIAALFSRLKEAGAASLSAEALSPKIMIDAKLAPSEITMSLIRELEILDPHGEGNPTPIFMSQGLKLSDLRRVGNNGQHLKLKMTDGQSNLETIGFNLGDLADQLTYNIGYDVAYHLEANEWNGFETAQLRLVDIREAAINESKTNERMGE